MSGRMENEIERTIYILRASMPKSKKAKTSLGVLLRIAALEMNIFVLLALFLGAVVVGVSSVRLLSMPMLTVFCVSPMPMLLLLHRYALAKSHGMEELEGTLYYSYAEMVSARFTIVSVYVFVVLIFLSMVLHFTAGESFLRLALCGAVPCIFLCTVLLFLSRITRNGEGMSAVATALWLGLCFLSVIFPFDKLLELCSTFVYGAMVAVGLLLYWICIYSVRTRRIVYVGGIG